MRYILKNFLSKILPASVCFTALVATNAAAISVDLVAVGNPGNAPDPLTGRGTIDYTYGIGQYEVTLNQYSEFLNAVAGADTYNLYSPFMESDVKVSGITRSGSQGSYNYSVLGSGNRPVTYVSWFDAARFVNWLNNGSPVGSQTAGSTETGAYSLNGATSGIGFAKNTEALYWIPSEDEWRKAAFHQPATQGGDGDDFWLYPTRSNIAPDHDHANYAVTGEDISAPVNRLTDAGTFADSASFYGTFDQGGNVEEWNDSIPDSFWPLRRVAGGSWRGDSEPAMSAYMPHPNDGGEDPRFETSAMGFRIAGRVNNIPEPSVAGIMMLGVVLLMRRRKTF